MKLAMLLEEIAGRHRCATADNIRDVFGDYHKLLRWLSRFLIGDERAADACIVDACTISESQTPDFHEWLIHWAARATVRCALQTQHAQLAPKYEKSERPHITHPPLSLEYFVLLIKHFEDIHARLDVVCRFVLVLRGITHDS